MLPNCYCLKEWMPIIKIIMVVALLQSIIYASREGHFECCRVIQLELLLSKCAGVNDQNNDGYSSIYNRSMYGRRKCYGQYCNAVII